MRKRIPDCTSNISLAIVLHNAGAPILGHWRFFTPEDLKRLGLQTIEEAHARRANGRVQISNEHTPKRAEIEAVFDRVSKGDTQEIPDLYVKVGDDFRRANEVEIAATLTTQALKVRSQLIDALSLPSSYILEMVDGEPSVDASDPTQPAISFPARRLISANASEATKAKIFQR